MKESKNQPYIFNAVRSSDEIKENAPSTGKIQESSSEVKPVERENLNGDVIKRQNELNGRDLKKMFHSNNFLANCLIA